MHHSVERFMLSAVLIVPVAFYSAALHAETKAGVAQTVQNHVFSIINGSQRPLTAGKDVFMDSQVRTEVDSETQLLLLDNTDFKIGPSSNVVIDRFVFDPTKPKGEVVINVTRGVFRFVTGKQDSSSYKIITPSATMGVRGTWVEISCTYNAAGKPKCEYLLRADPNKPGQPTGIDLTLTNPASPEFANISIDTIETLITIEDGKYKTSSWVAQNSLFDARSGDITGALGAAGGGSGGQTNPVSSRTANTGTTGNAGGGSGGGGTPGLTFTPGTGPTTGPSTPPNGSTSPSR